MVIAVNAAIDFFGTKDDLASSSALIAIGGFSIASDLVTWTNDDDALEAAITVELTMDAVAADNSGVNVFFRALNVDGSNDDMIPEAEYRHTPMGHWAVLNGITTIQRTTRRIALPNYKTSSVWEVYLENLTLAVIDAGWTVFITPITTGPHPA